MNHIQKQQKKFNIRVSAPCSGGSCYLETACFFANLTCAKLIFSRLVACRFIFDWRMDHLISAIFIQTNQLLVSTDSETNFSSQCNIFWSSVIMIGTLGGCIAVVEWVDIVRCCWLSFLSALDASPHPHPTSTCPVFIFQHSFVSFLLSLVLLIAFAPLPAGQFPTQVFTH